MSTDSDFREASPVIEEVLFGDVPDRATLLAGALALGRLCQRRKVSLELRDVAAFLERLAEGGTTRFRKGGRDRLFDLSEEFHTAWAAFRGHCLDCKRDTHEIGHYYMVSDELWAAAGGADGMLCLDCLEGRLGRRLVTADFTAIVPRAWPRIAGKRAQG